MSKKNKSLLASLISACLLLAQCGGAAHKSIALRPIKNKPCEFIAKQEGIIIGARALSYEETKTLFNNRGTKLRKRRARKNDCIPVMLSFENNTSSTWYVNSNLISLSQESKECLFKRMKHSPALRAWAGTGIILATLGALPPALLPLIVAFPHLGLLGAIIGLIANGTALLSTLIGGSIATSKWAKRAKLNNKMILDELDQKMVTEQDIMIIPNRVVSKLIFVKRTELHPQFKIIVEPASYLSKPIPFYIDLEQNTR